MDEPRGECDPPSGPGAWADALSVGLLLVRAGRVAWANAPLLALAGRADEPGALAETPLEALFEDAGAGLPDWASAEVGAEPVVCRLRGRRGPPVEVELAPLGRGAEPGSAWWELRAPVAGGGIGRLPHADGARRAEGEGLRREELLGVVSHELRTPLTVIAGFNKLLLAERAGPLTEEQRHFLEESARSLRRLAAFVGNAMGAARGAAGDDAPELREASLAETLEGVVRFLKPHVDERGQHVALEPEPGGDRARFDPLRVEQVLTNLLANAIRHSPRGGTIRVRTRPLGPPGAGAVEVAVDDEGGGVPEAERERIFRPYVRGAARAGGGGLGLGLALCRRIVEAHGGRIRAEGSPEGGARIAFTLPGEAAEEG